MACDGAGCWVAHGSLQPLTHIDLTLTLTAHTHAGGIPELDNDAHGLEGEGDEDGGNVLEGEEEEDLASRASI
jgi:hypothetical protein